MSGRGGAERPGACPIGVCLRTIRAEPGWWLESARRLDAAGYAGVWAWDHFMGQGDPTVPVVEDWTILSMAAGATERVTVGPFVLNVMNRHPAVVARMASTLQIASGGRLVLGIGIGGAPEEHAAYGIDFPAAPERVARLEEAVAVIRALWTGGPVTRDVAVLPAARRVRLSRSRTRRRRSSSAARRRPAPGWPAGSATAGSAFDDNFEANLPAYLEALEASGRRREDQRVHRRVPGRLAGRRAARRQPVGQRAARDLGALAARPARTARSCSPGRPPTSTPWSRPPSAGRRGRRSPGSPRFVAPSPT